MTASHLETIDAQAWPHLAQLPELRFSSLRRSRAEAEFAKACQSAGLVLDGNDPDLTVEVDTLFQRIAAGGWLGLAEGYMAGEWSTPDSDRLVKVLTRLLGSGYAPRTPGVGEGVDGGGELPHDLVRLYAGDGVSHQGGIYSTGVPTTIRDSVPSFAGGAKTHFVDVTTLSAPTAVDREDLASAQQRSADWLVDAARVGAGSHLLVYPASGVQAAVRAAARRSVVDVLTADPEAQSAVADFLVLEGAADNVDVQFIDATVPGPKQWRGRYDAVISVEKYEHLGPAQRRQFLASLDRLLAPSGRAVVQSTVTTPTCTSAARDALAVLQAYVWPALNYPSAADINKACDKGSSLRVIAQAHAGTHYLESLRQQRSFFSGRLREAAAAGFDPVYRKLWTYQFSLREALFALGMLDSVHFTLVHRNRGGRR